MKTILYAILLLFPICSYAEDFFFSFAATPDLSGARIEGDTLHVSVKIKRLPIPKSQAIEVVSEGEGKHLVRVYLTEAPKKEWHPMISLNGRIIPDGIRVTTHAAQYASYFEIELQDQKEANTVALELATLLSVPADRVKLKNPEAEQAVDGNPH